jgi:hypothetical protein
MYSRTFVYTLIDGPLIDPPALPFYMSLSLPRLFARTFATKASKPTGHVLQPHRYLIDNRVWQQLPPNPKTPWNLLQGLRIRINGVVSLFQTDQDLIDWNKMFVSLLIGPY